MKYSILINQKQGLELGLDWIDCGIFNTIESMLASQRMERIDINGGIYTWISMGMLLREIEGSGIKTKRGLQKRINKLATAGVIIRQVDEKTQKTYITAGTKFDFLVFTPGSMNETTAPRTLVRTPREPKFAPPTNGGSHYPITKDHLTINHNDSAIAENENSIQFEPKQYTPTESHPNPKQSLVPGAAKRQHYPSKAESAFRDAWVSAMGQPPILTGGIVTRINKLAKELGDAFYIALPGFFADAYARDKGYPIGLFQGNPNQYMPKQSAHTARVIANKKQAEELWNQMNSKKQKEITHE